MKRYLITYLKDHKMFNGSARVIVAENSLIYDSAGYVDLGAMEKYLAKEYKLESAAIMSLSELPQKVKIKGTSIAKLTPLETITTKLKEEINSK